MTLTTPSPDVLHRLADLLAEHRYLLETHPNDCDPSALPEIWTSSSDELTRYLQTGFDGTGKLPSSLKTVIDGIRALQLPRNPVDMSKGGLIPLQTKKGMSPKKLHEVQRMASYVKALVDSVHANDRTSPGGSRGRLHIVDVGAGQGHLTRALATLFPDAKLLALDADHGQTEGAERRGKQPERKLDSLITEANRRIDHKTVLLTPQSLLNAVNEWTGQDQIEEDQPSVPVLFIALHACGSLTPDMLRAFIARVSATTSARPAWHPLAVVAVGCCYNLMYPEDYPLSQTLRTYKPAIEHKLPTSAFHLAAQIPMTWLDGDPKSETSKLHASVQLATRKITWRAMLGAALAMPHETTIITPSQTAGEQRPANSTTKIKNSSDVPVKWWTQSRQDDHQQPDAANVSESLPDGTPQQPQHPSGFDRRLNTRSTTESAGGNLLGVGVTEAGLRLGKLPGSAYTQGWQHFLKVAGEKLGVSWTFKDDQRLYDPVLERRIEVLHTLRCFLGSAVETAILLDRVRWLREQLGMTGDNSVEASSERDTVTWEVELVNLFDQGIGSGRNVALVITMRSLRSRSGR